MKNKSICEVKGCRNEGSYCRLHLEGSLPKKKQPRNRAKKLDKLMRKEYVPQVKEMVEAGTDCELRTEVCTGKAQGFHHPYGKDSEEKRMKEKVPSCNPCNLWVEVNDAAARSRGLKKSKFSIPAKNQKIGL